jgi:hypothetical protein
MWSAVEVGGCTVGMKHQEESRGMKRGQPIGEKRKKCWRFLALRRKPLLKEWVELDNTGAKFNWRSEVLLPARNTGRGDPVRSDD